MHWAEPAARWGRVVSPVLSSTAISEAFAEPAPKPLHIDDHCFFLFDSPTTIQSSNRKRVQAPCVVPEHRLLMVHPRRRDGSGLRRTPALFLESIFID